MGYAAANSPSVPPLERMARRISMSTYERLEATDFTRLIIHDTQGEEGEYEDPFMIIDNHVTLQKTIELCR